MELIDLLQIRVDLNKTSNKRDKQKHLPRSNITDLCKSL